MVYLYWVILFVEYDCDVFVDGFGGFWECDDVCVLVEDFLCDFFGCYCFVCCVLGEYLDVGVCCVWEGGGVEVVDCFDGGGGCSVE